MNWTNITYRLTSSSSGWRAITSLLQLLLHPHPQVPREDRERCYICEGNNHRVSWLFRRSIIWNLGAKNIFDDATLSSHREKPQGPAYLIIHKSHSKWSCDTTNFINKETLHVPGLRYAANLIWWTTYDKSIIHSTKLGCSQVLDNDM